MQITLTIFIIALVLTAIVAYLIGKLLTQAKLERRYQEQISLHRKDAINRSRAVIGGQFSEQLAPFLPDYPYSPTETKFLGKPIDLLVFKGSDKKLIDEVVFVEVKSGKSTLNAQERSLKKAIENKNVSWKEYRIPESLTKKHKRFL